MNKRTLVLGGLAVAAVAGALRNRERVAGLLGRGGSEPPAPESATYAAPEQTRTPVPDEPAPAPEPSNYDLSGPAANTATPVPAPEPQVTGEGGIDEAAEEAAAAAEAAAIGGTAPEYTGTELGEPADDAERPVMEAGGGEAEGQEQAEAELQDNAEPAAGDPIEGGRQIEDVLDAAGAANRGEELEGVETEPPRADTTGLGQRPDDPDRPSGPGDTSVSAGVTVPNPPQAGTDGPERPPETGVAPDQGVTEPHATTRDDVREQPSETAPAEEGGAGGDESTGPLGGEQSSFFAGGKGTDGDPDETGGGSPADAAAPAEEAASAEGAGAGLPDRGASEAAERAARETPAEQKSSAVWSPPEKEPGDDDEGEWQTWSGRAVDS